MITNIASDVSRESYRRAHREEIDRRRRFGQILVPDSYIRASR